jgi:hypothetical protein
MPFPKNQQIRQRGETLGEASADEPFGFESKPMLDEKGAGLKGLDKQQSALTDQSSNLREPIEGEPTTVSASGSTAWGRCAR